MFYAEADVTVTLQVSEYVVPSTVIDAVTTAEPASKPFTTPSVTDAYVEPVVTAHVTVSPAGLVIAVS